MPSHDILQVLLREEHQWPFLSKQSVGIEAPHRPIFPAEPVMYNIRYKPGKFWKSVASLICPINIPYAQRISRPLYLSEVTQKNNWLKHTTSALFSMALSKRPHALLTSAILYLSNANNVGISSARCAVSCGANPSMSLVKRAASKSDPSFFLHSEIYLVQASSPGRNAWCCSIFFSIMPVSPVIFSISGNKTVSSPS